MAKKLNKVLGVDFGSQFIKIAEISQQGGRPAVTALGIAQTPEGAVDHMGISDDAGAALSSVLKQLAASSGSGSPDVVASIAGTGSVLVRTLEVPAMSKDELKKHMDWEITRNVPFAEPDPVSAYEVYESEAGAQNVDVVMAIAPPSKVSNLSQLVKKSGKKAAAFDVEPLALARLLATSGRADLAGKTVCVVEIGHKTTAINMYEDGQLLMPRQVPIGGELFTRAISEGLNVSMEEAEDIKINKAKIIDAAASAPVAGGGD
jgi:type IV pilus assembly protein PilM